jgi:hypothetical protein
MRALFLLTIAALCWMPPASAEELRLVQGSTVQLSDVVATLPGGTTDFEICKAPPAGASRLLSRREIVAAAVKSGVDPKRLVLPAVVRVSSAAKHWQSQDLLGQAIPILERALPAGVRIKHIKATSRLVTSPAAVASGVRLPKLPRRAGEHDTTATLEFENDGEIVARVPLSLTLSISAEAARPAITKGARVQLVIESAKARIAATAIALADGELGQTLQFRVASTHKVLFGKLESPELARVVQ